MAIADLLGLSQAPAVAGPDLGAMVASLPQASIPQQMPQKRGLFSGGFGQDSPLRNFIGVLADALSASQGLQPIYHQEMQKRRTQSAVSQYLGDIDPELAGLLGSGVDADTALGIYKVRHPANETPAALKEWEIYQRLPDDQKGAFIKFRQSLSPQILSPLTLGANDTIEQPGAAPDAGEVTATNPTTGEKVRWNGSAWEPMGGQTAQPSGNFPVSKVLDALTAQESGGDATPGDAVGPATRYGKALGSTQLLPPTAKEMAGKLGLAFVPQMLRSNDPKALKYQRALAEAYFNEGLQKTGNIRDALHYYHGGPDPRQWGPKTKAYADAVLSRLGGQ